MKIFPEFPIYKIEHIRYSRAYNGGVQENYKLVGLYVPFRYFSTDIDEKYYWIHSEHTSQ